MQRLVLLLSALCACAVEAPEVKDRPQSRPEVVLRVPVMAPADRPVRLDAGASFDPDGDPLTFGFEINGVVVQRGPSATCDYTFGQAGLYTVGLRATDIFGNERLAVEDVTAITDYPDPPNFCDGANGHPMCDECDGGVCYVVGGGVD